MNIFCVAILVALTAGAWDSRSAAASRLPAVEKAEFIFDLAPFSSCHASTIAETKSGLTAAWFGGTREGHPDVGIWGSRWDGKLWSRPAEITNGRQEDRNTRFPCWNPVLFQSKRGPLLMFYKVGPNPSQWWGMIMTSEDGGKIWKKPRRLPDGILGPIKNKPVEMPDGTLLCPSSTEQKGWQIHLERTADLGQTWTTIGPLNDGKEFSAIQPTILVHLANRLQLLCRSRESRITECWSEDGGRTWSPMAATFLPNPNSGIDGLNLKDGRFLLVYNPVAQGRTPLVVGISDDGKSWKTAAVLENSPGEYSYPAVIQTSDRKIHITYTWRRQRIKHVVLNPAKLG